MSEEEEEKEERKEMEEDPASAAEVYDTSRFSDLYHASRSPSPQHLGLAARFLVSLFRSHSVFFAFLGGWAVYLRGGGRRTEDVDVSVATSMGSLTEILLREERCDEPLFSFLFSSSHMSSSLSHFLRSFLYGPDTCSVYGVSGEV